MLSTAALAPATPSNPAFPLSPASTGGTAANLSTSSIALRKSYSPTRRRCHPCPRCASGSSKQTVTACMHTPSPLTNTATVANTTLNGQPKRGQSNRIAANGDYEFWNRELPQSTPTPTVGPTPTVTVAEGHMGSTGNEAQDMEDVCPFHFVDRSAPEQTRCSMERRPAGGMCVHSPGSPSAS